MPVSSRQKSVVSPVIHSWRRPMQVARRAAEVCRHGVKVLAFVGLVVVRATPIPADEPTEGQQESTRTWYRLVNVTIPPDSPLRNSATINKPPKLYMTLKKNGTSLGDSVAIKGWSVDFPKGKKQNWPIREGTKDRYSLELWDDQWGEDPLILSVTGLTGQSLRGDIYENGSNGMAKDRLVKFTFEPLEPTDDAPAN